MKPSDIAAFNQDVVYIGNALESIGALYARVAAFSSALSLEGDTPKTLPTIYAQRDIRWGSDKLGTGSTTIGGYGCLISSVASILTDAGLTMNPGELNKWLIDNHGYQSDNLFVFAAVNPLGYVKFEGLALYSDKPAPTSEMDAYLSHGYALTMVDINPKTPTVEEHWVRYWGNGVMIDPWYGDISSYVPRYNGKNAAEAILKVAYYDRVVPKG